MSPRAGGCVVGVVCDNCGCTYYYQLARIGTGAHTAHYGLGTSSASQQAQEQSETDLQRRLALEAELVPCPQCNWISAELVNGYRLGRYRAVDKVAFALGFAGSILSLVVAWFLYIGSPLDRWALPYVLIGGPATFAALTMTLLLLRSWLRGRIQPNRAFPDEPRLPPATPPALLLEPATECLRLAKPPSTPAAELLDVPVGRHELPATCCECLEPGTTDHGYPIHVTRLLPLVIPRCADCARKANREWQRISLCFAVTGLLIGCALVVGMARAKVELSIIIFSSLMLLGVTATLASVVASARTAPVKVVSRDRSRGVVRLRFRNPDYMPVVTQQLNATAQAN